MNYKHVVANDRSSAGVNFVTAVSVALIIRGAEIRRVVGGWFVGNEPGIGNVYDV